MTIRFGIMVPQGWRMDLIAIPDPVAKYEAMTRVAQEAERLGYDLVWLYDHFHTVPEPRLETTFECWTSTAALARDTSTIRIGQLVTCNNYRNPALLAKMASTVDVLSHGRLDFGIGAGWYEEEFQAFGYPYPDGPTRLKQLEEAVQIIRAMWTEDYARFAGTYYQVDGAINEPKGVQRPYPPLWIGGGGEQVTLRLVAQYADACNVVAIEPGFVRRKLAALQRHCTRLGRDYGTLIKSGHSRIYFLAPGETVSDAGEATRRIPGYEALTAGRLEGDTIVGTPDAVLARLRALIAEGLDYLVLYFRNGLADLSSVRRFATDLMPALREAQPGGSAGAPGT